MGRLYGKRVFLGSMLLAILLVICMASSALAMEDWNQLQISLQWIDADGTLQSVPAYPVEGAGAQVFWASVPTGVPESVSVYYYHPNHESYFFSPENGATVPVTDAGESISESSAIVISSYDESGAPADQYVLYVSAQPAPVLESIPTPPEENSETAPDTLPDEYSMPTDGMTEGTGTDGVPVGVPGQGEIDTLPSVPEMTQPSGDAETVFSPGVPAQELTRAIPVYAVAETGDVLAESNVVLSPGQEIAVQAPVLDGYHLSSGSTASQTVIMDQAGQVNMESVFFSYAQNSAPVTVSVSHRAGDIQLESESVTLTPGETVTVYRRQYEGYEPDPDTPEFISISMDMSGTVSPEVPVFFYHKTVITRNVAVLWQTVDGEVLDRQEYTLQPGQYVLVSAKTFEGFKFVDGGQSEIQLAMNEEGMISPAAPVFYYEALPEPVKSGTGYAVWRTADNTILQARNYTVVMNEPVTVQAESFEGYQLISTPESFTMVLDENGIVQPESVEFIYELVPVITATPVPTPTPAPVQIRVRYVDQGGNPLRPDQVLTLNVPSETNVAPETAGIPEEFDPQSSGPIHVVVNEQGEAVPSEVVFGFRHRESEETPIPAGAMINRWAETNTQGVNVRKGSDKSTSVVTTIRNSGSKVFAIESVINEKGKEWTRVFVDGQEGFISSEFVQVMSQAKSDDYNDTLPSPVPLFTSMVTPEPTFTPAPTDTQPPVTDTPVPTEIPATPEPVATPTGVPVTQPPTAEAVLPAPTAVPVTETPVPEQYRGYALTSDVAALRTEVSDADSSIIKRIPATTLVEVRYQIYDNSGRAWSQVALLDQSLGFIPDDHLRRINDQEAKFYIDAWNDLYATATPTPYSSPEPIQITGYAYTIGDDIPFRNTYSDRSVILSVLSRDTPVYVAGQVYDTDDGWPWHLIVYKGNWGYVRSDMVRMMSAEEENAYLSQGVTTTPAAQVTIQPYDPNSLSSYGYIYAQNNGAVNVRRTPSTGDTTLKKLRNYAFCLVLGSQNVNGRTWYQIQYDGITGYVAGDYFVQMSLAELEEFMGGPEYQQGLKNNSGGNANATAAPVVSQEEQNVSRWTNPESGLDITYATWAPFATTPPIVTPEVSAIVSTSSPTPVPSADNTAIAQTTDSEQSGGAVTTPSSSPLETVPAPTVEIEDPEDRGSGAGWIVALVVILLLAGGGYIYYLHIKNRKQTAQRAAQRKAQAINQQVRNGQMQKASTGTYASRVNTHPGNPRGNEQAGKAAPVSQNQRPDVQFPATGQANLQTKPSRTSPYARPESKEYEKMTQPQQSNSPADQLKGKGNELVGIESTGAPETDSAHANVRSGGRMARRMQNQQSQSSKHDS